MNADELFTAVTTATDVLRVETLEEYDSDSDRDYVDRFLTGAPKPDPSEKAAWLGFISDAHDRGQPWRRLRVVSRPVSPYTRYACEWGYTDNTAAGEDVRVVDDGHAPDVAARLRRLGDFYLVDDRLLRMEYDQRGAFTRAYPVTISRPIVEEMTAAFAWAVPFADWWASSPSLHRDLSTV